MATTGNGNGRGNGWQKWTWIVPIIVTLAVIFGSGWVRVSSLAQTSLSREEAYKSFVDKAAYSEDQAELCARLTRIEDKIDRLNERRNLP